MKWDLITSVRAPMPVDRTSTLATAIWLNRRGNDQQPAA